MLNYWLATNLASLLPACLNVSSSQLLKPVYAGYPSCHCQYVITFQSHHTVTTLRSESTHAKCFPRSYFSIMARSKKLSSSEDSALAERRLKREIRSRPWSSGMADRRKTPISSASPAPKLPDETVSTAVIEMEGREEVLSVPVPQVTSVVRMVVRHTREAAFACGSKLPRLATHSCSRSSTTLGSKKKAGGTASVVRSGSSASTSSVQTGVRRAVAAPSLRLNS